MPSKIDDNAGWYDAQLEMWDRADDLLAGTSRMREKAAKYIPKFELEGEDSYTARVKVTTLTNFYSDALVTNLGLMFREDPTLEKSAIPQEELDNIDNLGHNLNDFAYMKAEALLKHGVHHVQVDMPVNPGAETAGDDLRMGLRPYWVSVPARCLFNAFYTVKNNVRSLTQVRISGHRMITSGLDSSCLNTILMFEKPTDIDGDPVAGANVAFTTYIQDVDKGPYSVSPRSKDSGVLGAPMTEIPIVTLQINDTEFMKSRSTLDDMAFKNIEHLQVSSDHRNIFTASCYPILTQIGIDEPVTDLGSGTVLWSPGAKSTPDETRQDVQFDYISPESGPIEQGRAEKDQIIAEANSLMMKIQQRSGGDRTATGDTLDFVVTASPLQVVSRAVENGINRCLRLHAIWKGMKPEQAGKFKMPPVPAMTASEQVAVTEIGTARRSGDLSYPTYVAEMSQRGVFKTPVNPATERTRLDSEGADMFGQYAANTVQAAPVATPAVPTAPNNIGK